MKRDTIIGIAGAVLLVAAMAGIFKFEGSQPASSLGSAAFDVAWTTADANGPTTTASTPLGDTTETLLDISQTNLTRAKFTVTWTPTQGTDTLRVVITPPEGSGLGRNETTADSGEAAIEFDVPNALPPEFRLFANDEDQARSRVAEQNTKTVGTGEWTIAVTFESASGVVPVPGLPPVGADTEVQWDVSAILTHYVPELESPRE